MYIVFEGIHGSGKSTQIVPVVENLKRSFPEREFVITREPGGPLRQRLKSENFHPFEEASLFAQDRAYTLETIVKPALAIGAVVVSDRSFISSLAFQGGGRGLGINQVWDLNQYVVEQTLPNVVVYFDVGLKVALERSRKDSPDKFDREPVGFAEKVSRGYENAFRLLECLGGKTTVVRVKDVYGKLSIEETTQVVSKELGRFLQTEGRIRRER